MKFRLLSLALFIPAIIFAQNFDRKLSKYHKDRCGTNEHMQELYLQDPNRLQQSIEMNAKLQQMKSSSVHRSTEANTIYTIPVVVHVLWNAAVENISIAQIQSQIDVLNEDFGRTNADKVNTPAAFLSVASATNFQFCLAQFDPNGNATTGIERRQTSVTIFQTNDAMKHYSQGGLDMWDSEKYLNIWVCNLDQDILGYGELPVIPKTNTFGVVIMYNAFGRTGVLQTHYNKGRTCTHEISHCLNLIHIWGDDTTCGGAGDLISDTPDQKIETYDCPAFPKTDNCSSSSPGIMFMNYMDYTDDVCMNLFTAEQADRMMNSITQIYPALLSSPRCTSTNVDEASVEFNFSMYPNPSEGIVNLDMFATKDIGSFINVEVSDLIGKKLYKDIIKNPNGNVHQIDVSNLPDGVYVLSLYNEKYKTTKQLVLNK